LAANLQVEGIVKEDDKDYNGSDCNSSLAELLRRGGLLSSSNWLSIGELAQKKLLIVLRAVAAY
jgi:hypothetical protein